VTEVSGREILAENLGLIRGDNNKTIAVPVAQDTPADEADVPTGSPTSQAADEAAEAAAEGLEAEMGGKDVVSATEALDKLELPDGATLTPLLCVCLAAGLCISRNCTVKGSRRAAAAKKYDTLNDNSQLLTDMCAPPRCMT
jgi:hypothetical protein